MSLAFQESLFDAADDIAPGPLAGAVRRTVLGDGAWLDLLPGWVRGADALFARLVDVVPWRAERRTMYDRVVDVPRLLCMYGEGKALPDPALVEVKRALDGHYAPELGEPFATAGMCLYRDGRDSVAWHGDRVARDRTVAVVAIVSVGERRPFKLRPTGGGRSIGLALGGGDLLVMGGSCQRTWQHTVPKVRRAGPRISITFRHELR